MCGGSGVVQHALWAEYFKNHRSLDEAEWWFLERGVSSFPPEEIQCPICEEE